MPHGPRLDAPGTLHHVMARGIERQTIFRDDRDRADFVQRLGRLAQTGAVQVYACALRSLPLARTSTPWFWRCPRGPAVV